MAYLGIPQNTIAVLQKYHFNFQKKFGQNFLIDTTVLDRIISSAEITKEDCVLEIGPGIGTMTQYLAEHAGSVVAVEIDKALIPILEETLQDYDNVTVINDDILKVDINRLVEEKNGGRPIKVVANLPYYITTPIIMGLFESRVPLKSITIMVQKEVADKVLAQPGDDGWGMLSVRSQFYCDPYLAMDVPAKCFTPVPKVDSAFIVLPWRETPAVQVQDEADFFRVAQAAFALRRKTMTNGLCAAFHMERADAASLMQTAGLDERIRGEKLTLAEFARLADAFTAWKAKQA